MSDETKQFIAKAWPRVKLHALHYLIALVASSWNAGIATIVASLGVAAAAAIEPETIKAIEWGQMIAAFKYGAMINALFYLRSHPLPERLPTGDTRAPISA